MMRGPHCAFRILIGTLFLLAIPALCSAQITTHCEEHRGETVPKFKIERQFRGDRGPLLELFVSVSRKDISREAILALSCHIGQLHSSEPVLVVWIFDNRKAARAYNPQGEGNSRQIVSSLLGSYGFNKDATHRFHSLEWYKVPGDPRSIEHIDFGMPPHPEPS